MKLKTNDLWMIAVCALPLLLIFIAPALGINDRVSVLIFIAALFMVHLFMPTHGHKHGNSHSQHSNSKTKNTENHE